MRNKYVFTAFMLVCILFAGTGLGGLYSVHSEAVKRGEELTVVTSFYPMYIAAENIIGNTAGVSLKNLSEPQTGCLHDYQMTPEDMKLLSETDVFIVNGGGIESFLEEVALAYPELALLEASANTDLLKDGEEENAHAWMSVEAYETQIKTITAGLVEINPSNRESYEANSAEYIEKLEELKARQESIRKAAGGESVILFHEAYDYVADDLGLKVCHELDLDEERQISAGEVEQVIRAVNEDGAGVIIAEELYGKSMAETVQGETDVKVIYLDPLTRGDYNADSYIEGMSKNLDLLEQIFTGGT